MPAAVSCPPWKYEDHARYAELTDRSAELLVALRLGKIDFKAAAEDTRQHHQQLYSTVTPPSFHYYAGHYRGEDFACLKDRNVIIAGRLAVAPRKVRAELGSLKVILRDSFAALDAIFAQGSSHPREEQVYRAVRQACRAFVEFSRIHPYLNGNGHMGRWLVWIICGKYGIWPQNWPIHPRPPDPPYTQLIASYRAGNKDALEQFVLKCF